MGTTPYHFLHKGRLVTVWARTEREAFELYREETAS